MAAESYPFVSEGEYLARERLALDKSEYINGQIYAMAGASTRHVVISTNVTVSIGAGLRGKSCQPFNSDMRVRVNQTGLYTYPDLTIACPPLEFDDEQEDTLLNPTAIIEVLSPSTERYDRGEKFAHFRNVASLRDYVLIAQDQMRIEHFARQSDGSWLLRVAEAPEESVSFTSADCRLIVAEVYERVDFADMKNMPE